MAAQIERPRVGEQPSTRKNCVVCLTSRTKSKRITVFEQVFLHRKPQMREVIDLC